MASGERIDTLTQEYQVSPHGTQPLLEYTFVSYQILLRTHLDKEKSIFPSISIKPSSR